MRSNTISNDSPGDNSPDNNTSNDTNRRRFTRISFDAWTEIQQDDRRWNTTLIDLSLKGLLVKEPENWPLKTNGVFHVTIRLDPSITIEMKVTHVHSEKHHIGFQCESIDLESISHLRRIVELNMGSTELLERELHSLKPKDSR